MNSNIGAIRANISSHPGRKWFILSAVLLGAIMSAIDVSIVNVAMPTLKTEFGVSMAVIEWISMAYMLALTIFLPLFGRLADIYGKSKLYTIGFVIFSVGSLFCGLSSSAGTLIASRIVQAIGAGLLQANSVALITQAFPSHERGKAIGVQGAVQAISMAIGPLVGGILIATAGWRTIFYINIPIGVIGTVAALFMLPRDRKQNEKQKVDYMGAAFFALGLGLLVLAFNEGVKFGWGSSIIVTYLLSGIIFISLFVLTELKIAHPLIDLKLFKNTAFLLGNLTSVLSYYVLFAVMFIMPFYLERVVGYGVAFTGFLLTPLLLAMAAVAPISGYISDKYGSRIMTTIGMVVSALACVSLLYMGEVVSLRLLLSAIVLLGIGIGLFTPSNNSTIMGSVPTEKLATAGGVLNMTRSLGLILGVDISGGIFTALQHHYLADYGYNNVHHTFSNSGIPFAIRSSAFMHGFIMVIVVLLVINLAAAFLSASGRVKRVAIINHELTGSGLISSGFFNGFNQESRGTALFVTLLLVAGLMGGVVFHQVRHEDALLHQSVQAETVPGHNTTALNQESMSKAKSLALAYYIQKYHDPNVSVEIRPLGNHLQADIRKEGLLVKQLSINGTTVTEQRTGLRNWFFELLANI